MQSAKSNLNLNPTIECLKDGFIPSDLSFKIKNVNENYKNLIASSTNLVREVPQQNDKKI